jgi:hypothetical protein
MHHPDPALHRKLCESGACQGYRRSTTHPKQKRVAL